MIGNELYFFKSKKATKHRLMHCLTGTYLVDLDNAGSENLSDQALATSSKISSNSNDESKASVTASSMRED